MINVKIPYSTTHMEINLDESRIAAILKSGLHAYDSGMGQEELVEESLRHPICSPELSELACDAKRALVITSDHTRPVPSRITLPILLREIRSRNRDIKIKILIATGYHRSDTREEMLLRFGEELVRNECIINHDCRDDANMVFKGILPSGGELWLNSLADWADLVVSEGFIEPHFFAGFSGGRKSVLPGIASGRTVLSNHCSAFISDSNSRTGNLRDNPMHRDMLFASDAAKLKFILNVAMNSEKKIVKAYSGHPVKAHEEGCRFVGSLAGADKTEADIVLVSNGGYPLDQNIYQAVKGMTAGEACVRKGGAIIMVAACNDGHGGEGFHRWFKNAASPGEVAGKIACIPQDRTLADQWEAQILARVLMKCSVILVTDMCDAALVEEMHMIHASSIENAMDIAEGITGKNARITVIPDGVSVIIR